MLNKKHRKPLEPYHKDTICVVLPDGYKVYIKKYARRKGLTISEVVRDAVKAFFGF